MSKLNQVSVQQAKPAKLAKPFSLETLQQYEELCLAIGVLPNTSGKFKTTALSGTVDMAESKQKTKPKCTGGYSCGWACISRNRICRSEISKDNASAILAAIEAKVNSKGMTKQDSSLIDKVKQLLTEAEGSKASKSNTFTESNDPAEIEEQYKGWLKYKSKLAKAADKYPAIIESMPVDLFEQDNWEYSDEYLSVMAKQGKYADHDIMLDKNLLLGTDSNTVSAAKDINGNLAAVLVYGKDKSNSAVIVDSLVGHPSRTLGEDSVDAKAAAGAATYLLQQAAKRAVSQGLPLKLTALDSAKLFYMGLGFVQDTKKHGSMVLKGEALAKLAGV